ncbi:MAG: hypothetical protein ACRDR6_04620 [Pseudonocardiaceae bacterium]
MVELDGQRVELLPARIVLSLFSTGVTGPGGNGGLGASGGKATGGLGLNLVNANVLGDQTNYTGSGFGGEGGASTGGAGGATYS